MIFEELELWFDPIARSGPEAMAIDEWLLECRRRPLLRVYDWEGKWGSVGYFGQLDEAREQRLGLDWVRRWTGGGTVDHSCDWTYSLIVPRGYTAAELKGAESYRLFHEVLIAVLKAEGVAPTLSAGREKCGGLCFENPVEFDIENAQGAKLAGAAQRRGRHGLLHQGSVQSGCGDRLRGEVFSAGLARTWSEEQIAVDDQRVGDLVRERYGKAGWLHRR